MTAASTLSRQPQRRRDEQKRGDGRTRRLSSPGSPGRSPRASAPLGGTPSPRRSARPLTCPTRPALCRRVPQPGQRNKNGGRDASRHTCACEASSPGIRAPGSPTAAPLPRSAQVPRTLRCQLPRIFPPVTHGGNTCRQHYRRLRRLPASHIPNSELLSARRALETLRSHTSGPATCGDETPAVTTQRGHGLPNCQVLGFPPKRRVPQPIETQQKRGPQPRYVARTYAQPRSPDALLLSRRPQGARPSHRVKYSTTFRQSQIQEADFAHRSSW